MRFSDSLKLTSDTNLEYCDEIVVEEVEQQIRVLWLNLWQFAETKIIQSIIIKIC